MSPLPTTRRDWLRTSARLTLLGGLTAFCGTLLLRRGNGAAHCELTLACRACRSLDRCAFPEAQHTRQQQGSPDGR